MSFWSTFSAVFLSVMSIEICKLIFHRYFRSPVETQILDRLERIAGMKKNSNGDKKNYE